MADGVLERRYLEEEVEREEERLRAREEASKVTVRIRYRGVEKSKIYDILTSREELLKLTATDAAECDHKVGGRIMLDNDIYGIFDVIVPNECFILRQLLKEWLPG